MRFNPFYFISLFRSFGIDYKDRAAWLEDRQGFSVGIDFDVSFYTMGANNFSNRKKPIFFHDIIL